MERCESRLLLSATQAGASQRDQQVAESVYADFVSAVGQGWTTIDPDSSITSITTTEYYTNAEGDDVPFVRISIDPSQLRWSLQSTGSSLGYSLSNVGDGFFQFSPTADADTGVESSTALNGLSFSQGDGLSLTGFDPTNNGVTDQYGNDPALVGAVLQRPGAGEGSNLSIDDLNGALIPFAVPMAAEAMLPVHDSYDRLQVAFSLMRSPVAYDAQSLIGNASRSDGASSLVETAQALPTAQQPNARGNAPSRGAGTISRMDATSDTDNGSGAVSLVSLLLEDSPVDPVDASTLSAEALSRTPRMATPEETARDAALAIESWSRVIPTPTATPRFAPRAVGEPVRFNESVNAGSSNAGGNEEAQPTSPEPRTLLESRASRKEERALTLTSLLGGALVWVARRWTALPESGCDDHPKRNGPRRAGTRLGRLS